MQAVMERKGLQGTTSHCDNGNIAINSRDAAEKVTFGRSQPINIIARMTAVSEAMEAPSSARKTPCLPVLYQIVSTLIHITAAWCVPKVASVREHAQAAGAQFVLQLAFGSSTTCAACCMRCVSMAVCSSV